MGIRKYLGGPRQLIFFGEVVRFRFLLFEKTKGGEIVGKHCVTLPSYQAWSSSLVAARGKD